MPATQQPAAGALEMVLELLRPPVPEARPIPPLPRSDLPPTVRLLLDVSVSVSIELGDAEMELGDILGLGRSSLIMLDHPADRPLLVRVNGVPFARGEVVEVEGRYGVRITETLPQETGGDEPQPSPRPSETR